jgi:hypothetical protein
MIEPLAIILAMAVMLMIALICIDRHVRRLIRDEFSQRCTLCQFRSYANDDKNIQHG